ncbi:MAG: BrnA antitoxin family protein [Blastocatellia bacterium]
MKNKSGKKTKEVIIDVTEEDYRRSKAKGIKEEALLKPGRHKFARGANPLVRVGLLPATPPKKTRISILLDEDIIEHFKKRAAAPNALPYQTQINNTLRAAMMADRGVIIEVKDEGSALHNNPTFIKAVAKSVKEQLAQERKRQRKRA